MNGVFYIGATGLDSQQRGLEIVANNIANLNTPTFKQSHAQFAQIMGADPVRNTGTGNESTPAQPVFLGVKLDSAPVDFTQGTLTESGSALDVAINGTGFMELMGPGGQTMLWRGGTMKVNADGYLSAANGMPLQAMISVPRDASSLNVGADGRVTATVEGSTDPLTIGQINLVQDVSPSTLTAMSGGVYMPVSETDLIRSAPGEDGGGVLAQGFIETSNVDLASEMVSLLMLQRTYSANAQVVQAGDQLMAIANDLKR